MKEQPLLLSRASQVFDSLLAHAQAEQKAAEQVTDHSGAAAPDSAEASQVDGPPRHRTFVIAGVQ
ncbi:hypothetical protein [Paraburkholderia sp. MM6662-R1]|uniref:hypothetical protein n=1 Tax=Paraburkholderia sp. MM6662-R1 TaxID=2991066 RepID=UPI003D1ECBF7